MSVIKGQVECADPEVVHIHGRGVVIVHRVSLETVPCTAVIEPAKKRPQAVVARPDLCNPIESVLADAFVPADPKS